MKFLFKNLKTLSIKLPIFTFLCSLGVLVSLLMLPDLPNLKADQEGGNRARAYLLSKFMDNGLCVEDPAKDIIGIEETYSTLPVFSKLKQITFVVRANTCQQDPADIFRLDMVLTPDGLPIRSSMLFNLTNSEVANESHLRRHQKQIAYASKIEGRYHNIGILDLSGENSDQTQDWTQSERIRNKLTNLQETGQLNGVEQQKFVFNHKPRTLSLDWQNGENLTLTLPQKTVTLTLAPNPITPPELSSIPQYKGMKGTVPWLVDTVRAFSFIGPEKIALLERFVFTFADYGRRLRHALFEGEEFKEVIVSEEEIRADAERRYREAKSLDELLLQGEVERVRVWPPPRLKPILKKARENEGVWIPMTDLILPSPDRVPLFYQTWIRPDPERAYTKVYITAWDSDRVDINMVAGTEEPVSATGVQGTGQIPREGDQLLRLLGCFNGGFQRLHGRYGMMVNRAVIQYPRKKAATIARFADGYVGLGSWGRSEEIPESIVSFRQNLNPLVEAGVFNPHRRKKWGSTAGPIGSGVQTVRTGLCLQEGGSLAYFWGSDLSGDTMGSAMIAARCTYGIHLDMNWGHSGFEFYRSFDKEGKKYDAKKMVDKMSLLNYPRYIKRDARDFFYLTLRPSFFEPPITPVISDPGSNEGQWQWLTPELKKLPVEKASALPAARVVWTEFHPLADQMTQKVTLIKIPKHVLQAGYASFSKNQPAPKKLPASIMIPVPYSDWGDTELSLNAEGKLQLGGFCEKDHKCLEYVKVFDITDNNKELPPKVQNSSIAVAVDRKGRFYFAVSDQPDGEILKKTLGHIELEQAVLIPKTTTDKRPLLLQFPNGQITSLPLNSKEITPEGFYITLNLKQAHYPKFTGRMESRLKKVEEDKKK